MARHYLEQALALGDSGGGARFRMAMQRKTRRVVGSLRGDATGSAFVGGARSRAGDKQALIEKAAP